MEEKILFHIDFFHMMFKLHSVPDEATWTYFRQFKCRMSRICNMRSCRAGPLHKNVVHILYRDLMVFIADQE